MALNPKTTTTISVEEMTEVVGTTIIKIMLVAEIAGLNDDTRDMLKELLVTAFAEVSSKVFSDERIDRANSATERVMEYIRDTRKRARQDLRIIADDDDQYSIGYAEAEINLAEQILRLMEEV